MTDHSRETGPSLTTRIVYAPGDGFLYEAWCTQTSIPNTGDIVTLFSSDTLPGGRTYMLDYGKHCTPEYFEEKFGPFPSAERAQHALAAVNLAIGNDAETAGDMSDANHT